MGTIIRIFIKTDHVVGQSKAHGVTKNYLMSLFPIASNARRARGMMASFCDPRCAGESLSGQSWLPYGGILTVAKREYGFSDLSEGDLFGRGYG
jgi:hypothetical protein